MRRFLDDLSDYAPEKDVLVCMQKKGYLLVGSPISYIGFVENYRLMRGGWYAEPG